MRLARKWSWLLLLGVLVAGGAALGASLQLTPQYEASATLLVGSAGAARNDYNALQAGQQLTPTYAQMVVYHPVLAETVAKLGLATTPAQLAGAISVKPLQDTQLIQLKARDTDPARAASIANTVAQVFISQNEAQSRGETQSSLTYLQTQLNTIEGQIGNSQKQLAELQSQPASPAQQAAIAAEQAKLSNLQSTYATVAKNIADIRLADVAAAGSLRIVQPAVSPAAPVSPRVPLNVGLGAVLGLLIAAGTALFIERLDDKVRTPERVYQASGYTTVGKLHPVKGGSPGPDSLARSMVAEAYRKLRTNLQFSSLDQPWRSLLITSPGPGDGKTTVASNLAVILAQEGKQVILVDSDLRLPTIHQQFGVANERGLTNLLVDEALSIQQVLVGTPYQQLRLLTSGPMPPNPAELAGSERLANLLQRLLDETDVVLLDSPPILAVTDAVVLATRADATLLVVNTLHTRIPQLAAAQETLENVGAHVIGVALNRCMADGLTHYADYYAGYYGSAVPARNGSRPPEGLDSPVAPSPNGTGTQRLPLHSIRLHPIEIAVAASDDSAGDMT